MSQLATVTRNTDGTLMNLIRENASQESTFQSQFHRLSSKPLSAEDNEEPISPELVVVTGCNGPTAAKEALLVDSRAQALETPQVSEDLDLEVARALLPSNLEKVIPPRGKGHTMSHTTNFNPANADFFSS